MKRKRNPVGKKVAQPSGSRKSFAVRIPGVNISISLQPTRKGITVVKPRVSRVTIERGNPRRNPPDWYYQGYHCTSDAFSYQCKALRLYGYATPTHLERAIDRELRKRAKPGYRRKFNPMAISTTPGRLGWLRVGNTTRPMAFK